MAQKILGIDLGANSVKITVARSTFRGIQIDSAETVKVERASGASTLEAAMDAAISLIRARGWEQIPAAVCLPAGSTSYRVLHFPFPDAKRIAQTLAFEVDGKFAQPIDELVYDHVPAVSGSGEGLGVVAAIPEATTQLVGEHFKAAGISVRSLVSGAFALGQIAAALPLKSPEDGVVPAGRKGVSIVLDIGHRASEAAVLLGNQLVGARSFRVGAQSIRRILAKHGDTRALAEVSLGESLSAAESAALEPLAREVERLIHWLDADCSFYGHEVLLVGGVSHLPGIEAWLSKELARPVRRVPMLSSRVVRKVESRREELSWAGIGAAHSGLKRPLIELQSLSDTQSDESELLKRRLVSIAVVGVAILATAGVDTLAKVRAEKRQRDAYRKELELLSTGVFGTPVSRLADVQMLLEGDSEKKEQVVPLRGAMDLLAMITAVSTPGPAPQGDKGDVAKADAAKADNKLSPGVPGANKPQPNPLAPNSDASALSVVPVDAGIVQDDRFHFRSVDIREYKVEMVAAAIRASAKDRLKRKLQTIPCVREVFTGATRDYNEFKEFTINFEHDCFHQVLSVQEEE